MSNENPDIQYIGIKSIDDKVHLLFQWGIGQYSQRTFGSTV